MNYNRIPVTTGTGPMCPLIPKQNGTVGTLAVRHSLILLYILDPARYSILATGSWLLIAMRSQHALGWQGLPSHRHPMETA